MKVKKQLFNGSVNYLLTILSLATVLLLFGTNNAFPSSCTINAIISQYNKGLNSIKKKKYSQAIGYLKPLVDAGFGPAQRQLAKIYIAGTGLSKSLINAAFWASLAKSGGDYQGSILSVSLTLELSSAQRLTLKHRLSSWMAKGLSCTNSGVISKTKPDKVTYELAENNRLSAKNKRLIETNFSKILTLATAGNGANRFYLSMVDHFFFYEGSRYDRYIGWKKNTRFNEIRLSVSNFNDRRPDYFAEALMLVIKRRVFKRVFDSKLIDPFMRIIKGKRVYGSIYPDIRNAGFYKMMRQALEMGDDLPKSLRKYIDIIDEIHYNPASKHFIRGGTVDAKGAFYIKSISSEGHRMMFVRRKVLFSSPLFFLQTFIHEGTHAIQHQKAFNYFKRVKRLKKKLSVLRTSAEDTKKIQFIQNELKVKRDYYNRWYKGVKTKTGRIQDIAFECEATENEILAVKLIGGSPDVMKGSGYIKMCPKAQRKIIQWKEEIRKKR